jgi:hypothetical protein
MKEKEQERKKDRKKERKKDSRVVGQNYRYRGLREGGRTCIDI